MSFPKTLLSCYVAVGGGNFLVVDWPVWNVMDTQRLPRADFGGIVDWILKSPYTSVILSGLFGVLLVVFGFVLAFFEFHIEATVSVALAVVIVGLTLFGYLGIWLLGRMGY